MRPTLLMLHGWGLDAALWDGLRAALPDFATVAWDRGYFGAVTAERPAGPVVAVGHSLGALLLAGVPDLAGLVAINGFDRFAGEGAVAPRVIGRMRRRFAVAPMETLAAFRVRIGAPPPPAFFDKAALAADLDRLATGDARGVALPRMLVLHGTDDPLLTAGMRDTVFAGATRETIAGGGHMLPLSHAGWCADRIRAFAG